MLTEEVQQVFKRFCSELGEGTGEKAILILLEELGGLRVSVPSITELNRQRRNKRICNLFTGNNYEELALRFNLSQGQIRKIVAAQK